MSTNCIRVPNSDLRLVEGSVVMLARFPGTKWVVHEGWYNYNSCRYSGWYFSSIPAKTVIPVNQQDLQGLTLVSGTYKETFAEPNGVPLPIDYPAMPPHPGTFPPGPHHHGCHPEPHWPPVWPPKPPGPEPELPAFFSVKKEALLNAAFISLPTLKYRDALPTRDIPDGKIVRVNSVNGQPAYYVWSQFDDEWKQVSVEEKIEAALQSYYDKEEIDNMVLAINEEIEGANEAIQAVDEKADAIQAEHDADMEAIGNQFEAVAEEIAQLHDTDESNMAQITTELGQLDGRLSEVEDAVFNVKKLAGLTGSNTILVADDGGISDSGVAIGDDTIGEPSDYADEKTVATEKAVAKKVEESTPKWASF